LAAFATAIVGALVATAVAGAYTFTDTQARPIGPVVTEFDWTTDRCEDHDIPDLPARAFRDAQGKVSFYSSHYTTRRATGPDLNNLQHQCSIVMSSQMDGDPATYADLEWIGATYRLSDGRVFGIVHNEYRGINHPGQCPSGDHYSCWFNSLGLATSTNDGRTFSHASAPPSNFIGTVPYRYEPDGGPAGLHTPSNIVRNAADGYYYMMAATFGYGAQQQGACVLRTNNLADPTSWRAWDGSSYSVQFINPYQDSSPPEQHVCQPVSFDEIGWSSSSLNWSTYLNKWVLLGHAQYEHPRSANIESPGFYWSTSSDLINWTRARQLLKGEVTYSHKCGDENPVLNPSLLDPASMSTNFETIGKRAYLYFKYFNYGYNGDICWMAMDRDLMRVQLEFNKPPDCSNVKVSPEVLPSTSRNFFPVTVSGATEPDGEPMTVSITGVTQSEPVRGVGDSTAPDARRTSDPNQMLLRSELGATRQRVYRLNVKLTDSQNSAISPR
jgi:hypothetical protein